MSNHYHLVLKINSTKDWDEKQVFAYWSQLCQLPKVCQDFMKNEAQSKAVLALVYLLADKYQKRLIPDDLPPILNRLILDESTWLDELNRFKFQGRKAIGTVQQLKNFVENIKNKIKRDISLKPSLE